MFHNPDQTLQNMVIYVLCRQLSRVAFMHFLSSNPPACQNWGGLKPILVMPGFWKCLFLKYVSYIEETFPATISSVVWPSEKYQVNLEFVLSHGSSLPILGNCSQLLLQQLQGPSQELDQDQHFLCKHEQTDYRRQNWLRCSGWKLVQRLGRLPLSLYLYHYLYLYLCWGCLSLWLGISFTSLFEILELLFDLLGNIINRMLGRVIGRTTNPLWSTGVSARWATHCKSKLKRQQKNLIRYFLLHGPKIMPK